MPLETIDAIVLHSAPYRESTLLIRLLTRQQGVVRALARGARRANAQSQMALEPFAWIAAEISLRRPDALGTLAGLELREGWPWLRADLKAFAYAALAIETLGAVASVSQVDPFYFEDAVRYLTMLRDAEAPGSLTVTLLWRLLQHASFMPRLQPDLFEKITTASGEAEFARILPATLTYHFSESLLASTFPSDPSHGMRIPRGSLLPLLGPPNYFTTVPDYDDPIRVTARYGPSLMRWLIRIWEDHLHTRFRSADFLEKMILSKNDG